jgi:hypothetical protein
MTQEIIMMETIILVALTKVGKSSNLRFMNHCNKKYRTVNEQEI